jgi:serine/threonine-protein kinase
MSAGPERLVGSRYHLEALVGRGGMGEVWRARHVALGRHVAVKLLHAGSADSERARRRFLTEAQVTANLRTRHAVQVFDFGVTDDGRPFLVMELLEGETLDRRIARQGRLTVAEARPILEQAARALDRAHALGIVHRDFKPENVMLVADEEEGELVKVVDFGIAKLVGGLDDAIRGALGAIATGTHRLGLRSDKPSSAPGPARAVGSGEITSIGAGTPYYMAPEQVQDSAQVGPAADIWAFGVVAYQCLTGRRPFGGDSIGEVLRRVLAAEPPPSASRYGLVPRAFDHWFRVACARDPAARFPDLRAAAAALDKALREPVVPFPLSLPDRAPPADAPTDPGADAAPHSPSPLAHTCELPQDVRPHPAPAPPAAPAPRPRRSRRAPIVAAVALLASIVAGAAVHRGPLIVLERVSVAAPAPAVDVPPAAMSAVVEMVPPPEEPAADPAPAARPAPVAPVQERPAPRPVPHRPRAFTLPPLGL